MAPRPPVNPAGVNTMPFSALEARGPHGVMWVRGILWACPYHEWVITDAHSDLDSRLYESSALRSQRAHSSYVRMVGVVECPTLFDDIGHEKSTGLCAFSPSLVKEAM